MAGFSKGKSKTFWFSDARPEGEGKTGLEYDPHMYKLVEKTIYKLQKHWFGDEAVTNEEVKVLQKYLVEIGYLDPFYVDSYGQSHSSIDGYVGGRTHGAAKRYLYNFGADKTNAEIWDFIEDAGDRFSRGWKNLFGN
tara:strand:+ start:439 stop:849 length:411 start_codon:yes stop_codon:yes gene_type:complete